MRSYLHIHRGAFSPKTIQRKVTAFRSYGKFVGETVLEDYKVPTTREAPPKPLGGGVEDVIKMILACGASRRKRALLALTGLCGLRVTEARNITTDCIDLDGRLLTVRGKGDVTRFVPISERALPYLRDGVAVADETGCDKLAPYSDRGARQVIATAGERALGEHVASHRMRTTFGTATFDKTKNIRVVQELLGHSSTKPTERYTGVTAAAMREAVEL